MPSPAHRRAPRVALLIETTRSYTRELLSGVRSYVAAHGRHAVALARPVHALCADEPNANSVTAPLDIHTAVC